MLWSSTQVHFSSLGPCLSAWLSMLVLNAIFQLGCLRSFSLKMSWLLHIDCFTVPPNTAFQRQRWPLRNNSKILKHHQHSVRRIEYFYGSFVWIGCTQNCRPFWPHPPPTCVLTVLPIRGGQIEKSCYITSKTIDFCLRGYNKTPKFNCKSH